MARVDVFTAPDFSHDLNQQVLVLILSCMFTCWFTSKENLSLVSNTETSAFTTRCKLPVKLGATFYKELKSVKNMHTV